MGKSMDKRLEEIGASRFHKLGCADEATGLEETVEPWIGELWNKLQQVAGAESKDSMVRFI